MKTKEEIVRILVDELCYAYCDNCGNYECNDVEDNPCEFCHRKYQSWKISEETAEKIADKILAR